MSTIVRVKRRLEESPLEALVLHCKRPRTHEPDQDKEATPSLFVFSGTLDEKDHTYRHIKKEWLKNYEDSVTNNSAKDVSSLMTKLKNSQKNATKNQRLQILNVRRGIPVSSEDTEAEKLDCTVLDLHHVKDGDVAIDEDEKFAYDLYIAKEKDFDHNMLDDIQKIEFTTNDIDMTYRDNNAAESDEDMEDDDSNDENNWRNDYPEEEEDNPHSVDEDDLRDAVNRFTIDDDLSSDGGEEELVYGNSFSRDYSKYAGLSEEDVDRYGLAYAKYKLKLLRPSNDSMPALINEYSSDRSHGSSDKSHSEEEYSDASYKDAED